MKVIIAGSRFTPGDRAAHARYTGACNDAMRTLSMIADVTEVISGAARGADRIGEEWAHRHGVLVRRMPADWDTYGKRAGFLRNESMARIPGVGLLVALWDGQSKGTRHMINIARECKIATWIVDV